MAIQDDIATCLMMLRARGGALDIKAANLLEAMDLAGLEQNTELQALDRRVRALEDDLNSDAIVPRGTSEETWRQANLDAAYMHLAATLQWPCDPHHVTQEGEVATMASRVEKHFSTMRTEFRGAMHELDEVRITLAKALRTELHDGDTAFLLAHHVAQLVIMLREELGSFAIAAEQRARAAWMAESAPASWLHGEQWTPEQKRAFLLDGSDPLVRVKDKTNG